MKKFLIIIFIFLAGFIFAGTHSTACESVFGTHYVKLNSPTKIEQRNNFTDYENYVKNENLKNLNNTGSYETNSNTHIKTFLVAEYPINSKFEKIIFKNSQKKFIDNSNSKFNLYPRAP